ncbi:MAG: TRAP transporter large permease subunit [Pseudomonadota bacterium]
MEWYYIALILFASLFFLLFLGMPVAFCFIFINIMGGIFVLGGEKGLNQLILSTFESVSTFSLAPVSLFVFMGEILFHSGVALIVIDAADKAFLGPLPGRLSLLTVGTSAGLSAMSGSTVGTTALLGSMLLPEMRRRGYSKLMSLGPILGAGGLAIMIPPSGLAVILGALARISIGKILIGGLIPGLLMAVLYAGYIIIRCRLNPALAPSYDVTPVPWSQKIISISKSILPVGLLFFLVVGLIILGIATPSEAAAAGCFGALMLTVFYRKFRLSVVKKSLRGTLHITVMIFMIIAGAKGYSQILAFTGATRSLAEVASTLPIAPILIIVAMQVVLLFLGMFMDQTAMMMITLPVYMPIIQALRFDPVWFGVLVLINLEIAFTSPPFGALLFVMKGVAPPDTSMADIYRATIPFIMCDLIAMGLIMIFPAIATWLPGLII